MVGGGISADVEGRAVVDVLVIADDGDKEPKGLKEFNIELHNPRGASA